MFQYIQTPHLFFTREKSASQGGATVLKMLLAMFAGIPLGFLHAHLAEKNPWFVLFFTATYILLLLLITKIGFSKRYTWKYVKNANNTF
jgi:F0F1-type ATP synthase assembly protein I